MLTPMKILYANFVLRIAELEENPQVLRVAEKVIPALQGCYDQILPSLPIKQQKALMREREAILCDLRLLNEPVQLILDFYRNVVEPVVLQQLIPGIPGSTAQRAASDTAGQVLNNQPATKAAPEDPVLNLSVSELGLSPYVAKSLFSEGITNVREIARRSGDELLAMQKFKDKNLREVVEKLAEHNVYLKDDPRATVLDKPWRDVIANLGIRVLRRLSHLGVKTMRELVNLTADNLMGTGFGPTSLSVVRSRLGDEGLHLRNEHVT